VGELGRGRQRLPREADDTRRRRQNVSLFLEYLQDVPLAAWMNVTRQRTHDAKYNGAVTALRNAIRELGESEPVFATREAVLAQLQRFDGVEGEAAGLSRRWTRNLRPETEHAALAVLLRDRLSADDFAELYGAFEPLIPAALLFGMARER